MVDFTYYEKIAEGDKKFIIQMIDTFLVDVPNMIEIINETHLQKDVAGLAKVIHKLKPAWGMAGLDVALLIAIETEIKGNADLVVIEIKIKDIYPIAADAAKAMQEKRIELLG